MALWDSITSLFGSPETINWNGGGSTVVGANNGFNLGNIQGVISGLQPLANQLSAGQAEQQFYDTYAANPEYAKSMYGTLNDRTQVQNQGALLQLQQQEQQQKLKQQQALQQLASQVGGSPLEQLLAQTAPGSLAELKIQQQKLEADQANRATLSAALPPPPGSKLSPQPAATAGAASGDNPLNVRNNNPGNMRDPNTGEFQWFETPDQGLSAMTRDLALKIGGKSPAMVAKFGQDYKPTLSNLISTWAPSDENDTQAYINAVSQKTGIDPNQPLTIGDIAKLQPAMIQQEGGSVADQYFNGVPSGPVQPQPVQRQPLQAPGDSNFDVGQPANGVSSSLPEQNRTPLQSPDVQQQIQEQKNQVLQAKYAMAVADPEHYQDGYLKALAEQGVPGVPDKDQIQGETTTRKEFEGLSTPFINARDAYNRIKASAKDPSPAGDLALIYNYMKVLDPGSTVRESEFQLAGQAGSLPTQVQAAFNKLSTGERLAPEQRADFLSRAKSLYSAQADQHKVLADQYRDIAKASGFDAKRVVPDFTKGQEDSNVDQSAALSELRRRGKI